MTSRTSRPAALVLVGLLVLPACRGQRDSRGAPSEAAPLPAGMPPPASMPPPPGRAQAKAAENGGVVRADSTQAASMVAARKLIRTAQITVEVEKYDAAADRVAKIAERHGGYLADAQVSRDAGGRKRGTISVRVPAERFGTALAELKALGTVEAENVSAQDVSKAYTDLETRLRVKREAADRVREILRTKTAKLADVLEAERELARLTEEIEQMEGERRFYDVQIALSTFTLTLHEPEPVVRAGALAPITEALRDSTRVLATSLAALVYLVAFLLPWILLFVLFWLVVRAILRRRKAA